MMRPHALFVGGRFVILPGMRVIEWSNDKSCAFCARLMADLGAEVIKIEQPRVGDPSRHEGPLSGDGAVSGLFGYLNHGKRCITLDPRTKSGRALFVALIKTANAFIESEISLSDPIPGLTIAELRALHPNLTILSVTPYGVFPNRVDETSSPFTLQYRSAYAAHQARPVSDPSRQPPAGCADFEGPLAIGVASAVSVLWGMLAAEQVGPAPHIDMAGHDFYAAHLSPDPLAEWCAGERAFGRARESFGGTEVAGGLIWMLKCADGWILVSPREQHQWERWVKFLGNPEWSTDAALCGTREARKANFVRLQDLMSDALSKMAKQDIYLEAKRQGVACFPVNEAGDLLSNEQLHHRAFFDCLELTPTETVAIPGVPFMLRDGGGRVLARGRRAQVPKLGEANRDILCKELGVSAEKLEALIRNGIV